MKSQRQIRVYLSCNLHQTMINKHVLGSGSVAPFSTSTAMLTRFQSKTSLRLGFTVARGREEKRRMIGNGDPERGAPRKHRNQSYYAGGVGNYDMDSHDTYWTSWLVPIIVLANVAMFVVIMFVNNCPKNHDGLHGDCVAKFLLPPPPLLSAPPPKPSLRPLFLYDDYSLGVSLGIGAITCLSYVWFLLLAWLATKLILRTSTPRLEKLGALEWDKIVHQNQAWRLFTCIWLHAGVISFTCKHAKLGVYWNSTRAAIWIFQSFFSFPSPYHYLTFRFLVRVYAVRVGVIYLLSGIGGSILSSLFIRNNISVGASGALFGLLGAMLSELLLTGLYIQNQVGILPHVDNFAHIGGFLSGSSSGLYSLARPQFGWLEGRNRPADTRLKSKYTVYQYVFWIIATILLIVGFTVGLVMLFKGENANNKCSWCHYLSCVAYVKMELRQLIRISQHGPAQGALGRMWPLAPVELSSTVDVPKLA
ncbi:hypothetical protein SASPL_140754 [Salvia splendens]|uniref:RHOMBOID-like protein n=1 Tax=Salvia splendens TaxID=180675 RepID=A0A8X8WQB5_SALSN|nr:hypothetical protein SASPL_140754 [Salvia splendens]